MYVKHKFQIVTIVAVETQLVLHIVSACIAVGIQQAMRLRLIVVFGLPRSKKVFHIIS